jgi:arabinan endo-1,5-alpha-L-arabinosidase
VTGTAGSGTSGESGTSGTTGGTGVSGADAGGTSGTSGVSGTSSAGASGNGAGGTSAGASGKGGAGGAAGSSGTAGKGGAAGASGTGGGAGASGGGTGGAGCNLTTPAATTTHRAIGVHDPSMIHVGSTYYLFATGGLLNVRSSTDLATWKNSGNIFAQMPAWIATELGQTITDLWAPDISFYNGLYHVYYAGSLFGKNHSVIGLATNTTLNPSDAGYKWVDQGLVIESNKTGGTADNWNAIDPNLTFDQAGQPWLVFGSFWSGIKMRKVDPATGLLSTSDTTLYALANNSSIEASSIITHNGFYYLFVSYGACCKGVNSTYSTMVGRATTITGPYTDKAGQAMSQGHAETMLTTNGRYIGPGGGTAFQDCNLYYYTYHYYDGQANGNSYLMLVPITWSSDDWPVFGTALWQ